MNISDKYANKYLAFLRSAKNDEELVDIINKIYEDGFVDGTNEAELKNNE